ncbi:hypothetical protein D3C72_2032070 [compost metagenome]
MFVVEAINRCGFAGSTSIPPNGLVIPAGVMSVKIPVLLNFDIFPWVPFQVPSRSA